RPAQYETLLDRFLCFPQRACAAFLARAMRASLDIFFPAALPPMRPKSAAASLTSNGNLAMCTPYPGHGEPVHPPSLPTANIDIYLTAKYNTRKTKLQGRTMRGRIGQRGKSFYVAIYGGVDPETGKERRHFRSFKRRELAEHYLAHMVDKRMSGQLLPSPNMTCGRF